MQKIKLLIEQISKLKRVEKELKFNIELTDSEFIKMTQDYQKKEK